MAKAKRQLNRVQVHAKSVLSDQMFNGEQTRESFYDAVDKRFEAECKRNGEIYTRTVMKELLVDKVKENANQVLSNNLMQSTKILLSSIIDGALVSEDELWDLWMEVKSDGKSILIRAAQANMAMIHQKIETVKANTQKQVAALSRWNDAQKRLNQYLQQGMNVGDAMRQMGLVFTPEKNSQSN